MTNPNLRKKTQSLSATTDWYRLMLSCLASLLIAGLVFHVGSAPRLYAMTPAAPVVQQETPLLRITGVDTSKFPEVSVGVYGEGLDGGLENAELALSQDNIPVAPSSQMQTVGVQMLIAYDSWRNKESDDAVRGRLAEVNTAIKELTGKGYLADSKDWLAFMSFDHQSNSERSIPKLFANFANDNNIAINALGTYEEEALKARANTSLFDLIFAAIRAFDEKVPFNDQLPSENSMRFIVVFSDGFDNIGVPQLEDLKREANDRNIRILTVQIGSNDVEKQRVLQNIAITTDGRFEQLAGDNQLLPTLWTLVQSARQQRILTYRSTVAQPTQIKVQAKATTGGILEKAAGIPAPPLVLPQVKIVSPTITEITRSLPGGGRPESGTPPEQLEPKTLDLQIEVTWGSAQPRNIVAVEYRIGDVSRTLQGAEAKNISFPIESLGAGEYTIRAIVTDELGQKGEATQNLLIKVDSFTPQGPIARIIKPDTDSLERLISPGKRLLNSSPATDFEPKSISITVAIEWPDGQPRNLSKVEYRIDNAVVTRSVEPFDTVDFSIDALDNGSHSISVQATDADGRQGPLVTKPFSVVIKRPDPPTQGTISLLQPTVDSIKRTLPEGANPTEGTAITTLVPSTVDIEVDIQWKDYPDRKLKQVEYRIGDVSKTLTQEPFNKITFPIDLLDQSGYTIRVIATDEFNIKTEAGKPLTIQIDWKPAIPWWAWVALALSVISLAFAIYMWWNPRFRRRVTQVAANVGTSIGTRIWGGGGAGDGIARARLERVGGGNAIPVSIDLFGGINKLGRSSANATIQINDPNISRLHCRIEERNGTFWVYDEGSANGTKVNGQRVTDKGQMLEPGNVIGMGPVKYRFEPLTNRASTTVDEEAITHIEGNTNITRPDGLTKWDQAEKSDHWNSGSTVADVPDATKKNQQPGGRTKPSSPSSDYVDEKEANDPNATQVFSKNKTKPSE